VFAEMETGTKTGQISVTVGFVNGVPQRVKDSRERH